MVSKYRSKKEERDLCSWCCLSSNPEVRYSSVFHSTEYWASQVGVAARLRRETEDCKGALRMRSPILRGLDVGEA
jgi:hypothetical protein